jgi:hypothetical protein
MAQMVEFLSSPAWLQSAAVAAVMVGITIRTIRASLEVRAVVPALTPMAQLVALVLPDRVLLEATLRLTRAVSPVPAVGLGGPRLVQLMAWVLRRLLLDRLSLAQGVEMLPRELMGRLIPEMAQITRAIIKMEQMAAPVL